MIEIILKTLIQPHMSAVFEKTCVTTQKNVKSHVFLDFEKT